MSESAERRQVGHALFFDDGQTSSTAPTRSPPVFRHELLPLLQEYLYEDYTELAAVLGPIIDTAAQRPSADVNDPEALCVLLADHLSAHASS